MKDSPFPSRAPQGAGCVTVYFCVTAAVHMDQGRGDQGQLLLTIAGPGTGEVEAHRLGVYLNVQSKVTLKKILTAGYVIDFRERGRKGEKHRSAGSCTCPNDGSNPNLLVFRTMLQPVELPSQGRLTHFYKFIKYVVLLP